MSNFWILSLHVLVISAAVLAVLLVDLFLRQLSRLRLSAADRILFSRGNQPARGRQCIAANSLCDMPGRTVRWPRAGKVLAGQELRWMASLLAVATLSAAVAFPENPAVAAEPTESAKPAAKPAGDWVSFHNGGNTSVTEENLPVRWSPEDGIAWQRELAGYGQSAPVVTGDRLYLTAVEGKDKSHCLVTAVGLADGSTMWEQKYEATVKIPASEMVSRAAPTPLADAQGVYALFESGDLFALATDGKLRWRKTLFDGRAEKFQNQHGFGSSPAQTDDLIIVLVDHAGPSFLTGIRKSDGSAAWQTSRGSRGSWTSPHVTRVDGQDLVIVSSNGSVDAYAAATGKQLWSLKDISGNTVCSATVQGDRVYVGTAPGRRGATAGGTPSPGCLCLQIEPGSEQGYRVLWKAQKASCSFISPLVHQGRVYCVNRTGAVTCVDAETGEIQSVQRVGSSSWAQPIAAGDHLWYFARDGVTTVLQAGSELEQIAVNRFWAEDNPPKAPPAAEEKPSETRPAEEGGSRSGEGGGYGMDPVVYAAVPASGRFIARLGQRLYAVEEASGKPAAAAPSWNSAADRAVE
ncbi:MAG: PQQ-binding-like beta-propeller repeat protein [Planctomycetaceae bacterium]|nr:PQQ-binding-like beta-propeller repeat protein [Planctomycetaceae bacterium]